MIGLQIRSGSSSRCLTGVQLTLSDNSCQTKCCMKWWSPWISLRTSGLQRRANIDRPQCSVYTMVKSSEFGETGNTEVQNINDRSFLVWKYSPSTAARLISSRKNRQWFESNQQSCSIPGRERPEIQDSSRIKHRFEPRMRRKTMVEIYECTNINTIRTRSKSYTGMWYGISKLMIELQRS